MDWKRFNINPNMVCMVTDPGVIEELCFLFNTSYTIKLKDKEPHLGINTSIGIETFDEIRYVFILVYFDFREHPNFPEFIGWVYPKTGYHLAEARKEFKQLILDAKIY